MRCAEQPAARPPSIKDIARLAQVTHPTVSRALRNSPLVSAETAARIRHIAEELGYHASALARGLATRQTQTVGLLMEAGNPFAGEVARGVAEAAGERGYALLLVHAQEDAERAHRAIEEMVARRVDGIVVASPRARDLPLLEAMRIPLVLVDSDAPGKAAPAVMIANREAMRAVAQHLIGLGHRRIAYLGDRNGLRAEAARLAGYKSALGRAGIGLAPERIVACDGSPEAAMETMHELLRLNRPPTAVCCASDLVALGAMQAMRTRRLRVPNDLSVTGFGDLFFAAWLTPPLTTVRQPARQMGALAMENLCRLLAGDPLPAQTCLDAELILRGSTARAPKQESDFAE